MNYRIKLLAEQANIKLDYFGNGIDIDGGNPNVSEFAKLIIKECAEVADSHWETADEYCINQSAYFAIKKHFGVEE
jgi:hypothetical protein